MASLNKHFKNKLTFDARGRVVSTRQGPLCPNGCGAPFSPVCPTKRCPGRDEPLRIIRSERGFTEGPKRHRTR